MDNLLQTIRAEKLIAPGSHVVCAVSGGADSMALLWALYRLRAELALTLTCAHFNHGLRGAQADADEAFVRDFCHVHAIDFIAGRGDVAARAAQTGESTEQAARTLRYAFLRQAAGENLLATAHNADDNLETMLLRLTRGTSVRGLSGIAARQGNLIRPLLSCTRSQIEAFLRSESVRWREDATNATDFCLRNRLRHHVLPLLREENPSVALSALTLGQTLREEDAFLSRLAAQTLEAAETAGGGYDCRVLRAMEPVLQRRALFAILQQAGLQTPRQAQLQSLQQLLATEDPSAQVQFEGGVVLRREYETILPGPAQTASFPPLILRPGSSVQSKQAGWRIACSTPEIFTAGKNSSTTFYLRCDMIQDGVLTVRPRETGDRLQLPGGSRSVKRLLIDRKIPAALRSRLPVLTAAAQVLAVGGIGADIRYRAIPGKPAICIRIIFTETDFLRLTDTKEKQND